MFSQSGMSSTVSVLSTYTTFAASAMVVRTVVNEVQSIANQFIPEKLRGKILFKLGGLLGSHHASEMVFIIQEFNGLSVNEIYQASELYLGTRITSSVGRLNVSKGMREKNLSVTVSKGETVLDVFEGVELRWQLISTTQKSSSDYNRGGSWETEKEQRSFELVFHKKHKEKVLNTYLPYVVERSKAIKEENKVLKLYSLGNFSEDCEGPWGSINLTHPSTFDTLAMDDTLKKELIADLDRFVKRRDFYKKVGKAWKRGYLLYGPPGTGKSSLVAAMANYLKFNIYDLELTSLYRNSELRRLLVSTENRSILVIEDIDCSIELQNREHGTNNSNSQLTLSGLLNFIDGLWSSCGDERILVFTTNHKERLDPALLRAGRMDMHINMSYCTPSGFKTLAANYLNVYDHPLFTEIEKLMIEVEVTPAGIAEELLKYEDAEVALPGIIKFLEGKKMQVEEHENFKDGVKQFDEQEEQVSARSNGDKMGVKRRKMKRTRRARERRYR